MILDNAPQRTANSSDDNLIPLINVVFLMLIFFMVAGHIEQSDGIDVSPPESSNETDISTEKLKIVVSKDSEFFIEGKPFSLETLPQRLNQYLATFSEQESDKATIELKADSLLTADDLQAILMQLKSAGLNRVSLITKPLD